MRQKIHFFSFLVRREPDIVVKFLMDKLESGGEAARVGSLTIVKHLINTDKNHLAAKIPSITAGLHNTLNEKENKVIFLD